MEGPWSKVWVSLWACFYFLKIWLPVEREWKRVVVIKSVVYEFLGGVRPGGEIKNFWCWTCIPSEGGFWGGSQKGWRWLAKPWERLGQTGKSSSTRNPSKNIELENDTKVALPCPTPGDSFICICRDQNPLLPLVLFSLLRSRLCKGRLKTWKWMRWTMHHFSTEAQIFSYNL